MSEMAELDDYELAGVVREREIAFQEALGEVARRAASKGYQTGASVISPRNWR